MNVAINWRDLGKCDPHKRLCAAIILKAVRDAQSDNGHASEARRWLAGDPLAATLLDYIEVDHKTVFAWLDSQKPTP